MKKLFLSITLIVLAPLAFASQQDVSEEPNFQKQIVIIPNYVMENNENTSQHENHNVSTPVQGTSRGKKRPIGEVSNVESQDELLHKKQKIESIENFLSVKQFFDYHSTRTKFQREEIIALIMKGQTIIKSLLNKKEIDSIYESQKLEIFEDKGQRFSEGILTHSPSAKSIANAPGKALNVLTGFLGISSNSNQEREREKEEAKTLKRQQSLEAVIAVSWAIAYAPCIIEQGFVRGSFSIKDDDKLLNNFFEKYAIKAAHLDSENIKDLKHYSEFASSSFAYSRMGNNSSSHYQGQALSLYGIDSCFESTGYPLTVLPYNNKHIHFGRVHTSPNKKNKEKTFCKFEPEGLGDTFSKAAHAKEYFKHTENIELMRREKDILPIIEEEFKKSVDTLIGWDQTTKQAIFTLERLEKHNKPNEPLTTSKISICQMVESINNLSKTSYLGEQSSGIRQNFLDTLVSCGYSLDNLEYRTGNEVILSLEEIANAAIQE